MADVLNRDAIKTRLIAKATGFTEQTVNELLVRRAPLSSFHLNQIERHRGLAAGALARYISQTINDLWAAALLYGATEITTDNATVAVAAPYVTALAGVLLAGEALKAGTPALSHYRLGPDGPAIKYDEDPYATPLYRRLTNPARWPTSECLCRSNRRIRILRQRYEGHHSADGGKREPTSAST